MLSLKNRFFHPLIILTTLILFPLIFWLYHEAKIQNKNSIKETAKLASPYFEKQITKNLNRCQFTLKRLAVIFKTLPAKNINAEDFAKLYINPTTGFEAIALLTYPNLTPEWVIWAGLNSPLKKEIEALIAKEKEKLSNTHSFISRISLPAKNLHGFLIAAPMIKEEVILGWVIGVITDPQIFEPILSDAIDHIFEVEELNGQIVYRDYKGGNPKELLKYESRAIIHYQDTPWILSMTPTKETLLRELSSLPEVILLGGILLSGLVLTTLSSLFQLKHNQELASVYENQLSTLVNSTPDAVISISQNGTIVGWNPGAEAMFGYKKEEILNKHSQTLVPIRLRTRHLDALKRMSKQTKLPERKTIDFMGLRKNGEEFPIELSLSTYRGKQDTLFSGIVRDVTERKIFEDTLRLERDAAEDGIKMKSEFLSSMSHEIRTPLTSILGYCDLILSSEDRSVDINKYATVIQRNGEHLLAIINDILDLSKIDANRLTVESTPASPKVIIDEVIHAIHPQAAAKNLSLNLHYDSKTPKFIQSDGRRITQILFNLINNAIKFTKKGGVEIFVKSKTIENIEFVEFSIKDTGIGIQDNDKKKMFQPFSQAESSTNRQYGGTGLGLIISQKLVKLLKGEISYTSSPGIGSEFTVLIPVGNLTSASLSTKESPSSLVKKTNQKILLAEDNEDTKHLIKTILINAGYEVTTVANGLQAVEKAEKAWKNNDAFSVILMDISMPEMDGYTATKKLREQGYPKIIIALTAYSTENEENECLKAGCDLVITKPINKDFFLSSIHKLEENHHSKDSTS